MVQLFFFVAVGLDEVGQLVFGWEFLEVLGDYFAKVEPVFALVSPEVPGSYFVKVEPVFALVSPEVVGSYFADVGPVFVLVSPEGYCDVLLLGVVYVA